jgi:hypothetical protein
MSTWTIYNNIKPWQHLSNEQKGSLLLANQQGAVINRICKSTGVLVEQLHAHSWLHNTTYFAVKSEPEMWEVLRDDLMSVTNLHECGYKKMIAMGWTKNDK